MDVKYIVTENPKSNDCYTMLGVVTSYIDWEKKQKRVVRGGQVMYDVRGTHKFLYMHELYEYWYKNVLHGNYT